jgi:hypothetical protein
MNETALQGAQRELAELYRRLAIVRPLSRERIRIHMQIARVKKRIAHLQRATPPSPGARPALGSHPPAPGSPRHEPRAI